MSILMQIGFWIAALAIAYSYVIYPILLQLCAKKKQLNQITYTQNDDLPYISILMAIYNEDEILEHKIDSIYQSKYPDNKFEVLVGSDASTDGSNKILTELQNKYKSLSCFFYNKRQGKGNIINQLYDLSKGEILVITDANIMFSTEVLFELIKHFKNERIGLTDSRIINTGLSRNGISIQEKSYISREAKIKQNESILWGSMMGPFGGCYAVKKCLFEKIPVNYLVDDFYINMIVISKGFYAINDLNAIVYEDVSNDLYIEFKRKIRIATGNFQNLFTFLKILWPINKGPSISFLAHKVLRWFGPFFIITTIMLSFLLKNILLYKLFFYFQCLIIVLTIFDFFLRKIDIHVLFLRFITHFLSMNLAMLIGFFRYIIGVKSNVWQPTKRNQF